MSSLNLKLSADKIYNQNFPGLNPDTIVCKLIPSLIRLSRITRSLKVM